MRCRQFAGRKQSQIRNQDSRTANEQKRVCDFLPGPCTLGKRDTARERVMWKQSWRNGFSVRSQVLDAQSSKMVAETTRSRTGRMARSDLRPRRGVRNG